MAVVPCACAQVLGYDDLEFAAGSDGGVHADAADIDGSDSQIDAPSWPDASGPDAVESGGAGGSDAGETGGTSGEGGTSGAGGTSGTGGTGGAPPTCPDGVCNGTETCASCPADCGACCAHAPLACGRLGAQTLDATTEFKQFLAACPRVAKWVSGGGYADFGGMRDYKCACNGGVTVLRIWGPYASYATGDDLWNARFAFLASASPDDKALVDYLEADNECDAGHCFENPSDYNAFLLQFVARAKAAGFHPLIGNIAVGNPGGDVETCSGDGIQKLGAIVPAILAARDAGGGWAYHSYTNSWDKSPTAGLMSYLPFRYRRYLNCFPELATVPLILTEAGFDKGGNPDADGWQANGTAQTYLDWLSWYQSEIAKDGPVVGAALFTFAPAGNWSSFRLDPIASELASVVASCP